MFVAMKPQLSANWPDMLPPTNDIFWEDKFKKHGTCMTSNQAAYFGYTLHMKAQFIQDVRAAIGFAPNNFRKRKYQDFVARLQTAYHVFPEIVCKRYPGKSGRYFGRSAVLL